MLGEIKTFLDFWSVDIIIAIFALLFALQSVVKLYDWICDRFGIQTKRAVRMQSDRDMLLRHEKQLNTISSDVHATKDKINVLSQMIIDMQNKADATERARLKDRISQAYRYYHEKGYWNRMEKEAFEDLIADYEAHGGQNSFVHSICEPESCTWKLIN